MNAIFHIFRLVKFLILLNTKIEMGNRLRKYFFVYLYRITNQYIKCMNFVKSYNDIQKLYIDILEN